MQTTHIVKDRFKSKKVQFSQKGDAISLSGSLPQSVIDRMVGNPSFRGMLEPNPEYVEPKERPKAEPETNPEEPKESKPSYTKDQIIAMTVSEVDSALEAAGVDPVEGKKAEKQKALIEALGL